eukprot:COSAG02_NODE_2215_length_9489_cov_4.810011_10_plen_224_part_00
MPSITNESFDFGITTRHIRHLPLGQECVRDFLQRVCEMPHHCAECPSETGCVATGSFSYSLMPSITTVAVLRGGVGGCVTGCSSPNEHAPSYMHPVHSPLQPDLGPEPRRRKGGSPCATHTVRMCCTCWPSVCAAPAGRSLGRRLTVTSSLYGMSFCILANGVSGQCMVERISRASGCTWYSKVPNSNPLADAINPFILDLSRGAPYERTLGASFRLSRRALF